MPPATGSRGAGAATASDRRQSTRQGRTSVTRPTNYYARNFAGRGGMGGYDQTPPAASSTPGFLPALTHFTAAVDAFPKELIKHFSMFKEVEAKIHDPEQVLKLLLEEVARQPIPTQAQRRASTQIQNREASASASAHGSAIMDAPARHQQLSVELFPADFNDRPAEEQADLRRRQLFFRLRMVMASMIPTLDEKLVVLTSAKTTKDKGLTRMMDSYVHLDDEISEEARYGSLNHWAYADKEEKKKGGASHERHRREVATANNLAAAAQHVNEADSIAAKSELRREAMLAKRSRNHHDSDFDERPVKKTQKRKVAAAEAEAAIGLGIIGNGAAPQSKRKKTEKALAAAAAAPLMERSLSGALQVAASGGRAGASPRATPGVESSVKRKPRAPPGPTQARKRALPTYSPPLASSPIGPNFAIAKPAVPPAERPTSSRARKNSIANSVASAAQELPPPPPVRRPSSSHSVLQLASSNAITELEQAAGIARDNVPVKRDTTPKESVDAPPALDPATLKHEEIEPVEPESMEIDIPTPAPVPAPVAPRGGRASKTATPIVGTFPEIPMVRSRSTRNGNNGNGNGSHPSSENNSTTTGVVSKRGHKKNAASVTAVTMPSPALNAVKNPKSGPPSSSASSIAPDPEFSDGVDEDGDEPRFCHCNEVSYGNMIACDNDNCPREWFHLACVGMEKVPSARAKWYCSDECKDAAHSARPTRPGKGGRPGSSRQ